MTAPRRRHTVPDQPELPLHQPPVAGEARRDEDWRLDEETRQIGLRGVALARARLVRSDTTGQADPRRGRGRTGRAA